MKILSGEEVDVSVALFVSDMYAPTMHELVYKG